VLAHSSGFPVLRGALVESGDCKRFEMHV